MTFRQALDIVPDANNNTIHDWSTYTTFRHKEVAGIWNKFADKTDIVTIDANDQAGVIAAGDELGLIKLFRFPSEKRGAHFRKYVGHSSRIGMINRRKKSLIHFFCFVQLMFVFCMIIAV